VACRSFAYTLGMTRGIHSQVETSSPGNDSPTARPNRLAIGHLLLWTAATAVVFAALVTTEQRFAIRKIRQTELGIRIHHAGYCLALAVAPAYGAAIAGIRLATWRVTTQRWGFPTQPGHWLLVSAGVVPIAIGVADLNYSPGQNFAHAFLCWLGLLGVAVTVTIAAQFIDQPLRWMRAFQVGSWGLLLLAFELFIAGLLANGDTWLFWYVLNLVLSIPAVVAVFLAFLVSLLDLRSIERWDALHWIGLATFWIIVGHPILSVMIDSWMVGSFRWILV
jgi:hypothetical protein